MFVHPVKVSPVLTQTRGLDNCIDAFSSTLELLFVDHFESIARNYRGKFRLAVSVPNYTMLTCQSPLDLQGWGPATGGSSWALCLHLFRLKEVDHRSDWLFAHCRCAQLHPDSCPDSRAKAPEQLLGYLIWLARDIPVYNEVCIKLDTQRLEAWPSFP